MLELEKILLQMGREKKFPQGALLHKKGESPTHIYLASKKSNISGGEPAPLADSETKVYGLMELISDKTIQQNVVVESNESTLYEISKDAFKKALVTDKLLQSMVMKFILNRLSVKEFSFE